MKTQCSYGHHYDDSIFPDGCPQCKQLGLTGHTEQNAKFNLDENVSRSELDGVSGNTGSVSSEKVDNAKTQSFFNPDFPWGNGGEDRTIPNRNGNPDGRSASNPQPAPRIIADPVVGWLVCIKGINFGKSFPIYYGRNFIGRNDDNDVCLRGDQTVSKEKHAIIVYEPKLRKYFAADGESHSIYYVNNEVVMGSTPLNAQDIIEIGATKLLFVPLCNEKFGWDDVELLK